MVDRILVFDFDGLIVDSKRMYIELIKKALEENGQRFSFEEISEKLIPSIKGTIERILPEHMENKSTVVEKSEEKAIELTSTDGLNFISLCDDAANTIRELMERGSKMYLLSNSHSTFIEKALRFFNIDSYFEEVFALDSGFSSKDDALRHISKINNVGLADVTYIGDTENDVKLARRVGCRIIIVFNEISWNFPNRQRILDSSPDSIIEKFGSLVPLIQSYSNDPE
jgi:pyrophosphatase PpaX